jgi:hypothetical protein
MLVMVMALRHEAIASRHQWRRRVNSHVARLARVPRWRPVRFPYDHRARRYRCGSEAHNLGSHGDSRPLGLGGWAILVLVAYVDDAVTMRARRPNPRLQRTRWRSPLSRQPLGEPKE